MFQIQHGKGELIDAKSLHKLEILQGVPGVNLMALPERAMVDLGVHQVDRTLQIQREFGPCNLQGLLDFIHVFPEKISFRIVCSSK